MRIEADQFGRAIPFGDRTIIEKAHPGGTLELTIDSYLQFEAERALATQVKRYSARSGVAIVMDPWTGEVLALASVPDFDPAHFAAAKPDALRDRAVEDAYEPGSTFKLITATAALESGRISPDARFPARDSLAVGGRVIHNAEDGFMAGSGSTESIEDIIAYSHNVGAAELGAQVGPAQMYRTIRAYGFGDPTEIELPGENPGIVPPVSDWSGSSLATISFGHGISTTPIALVRAYAAIANGGLLLRPRIVRELEDSTGKPIYHYPTEVERRVMSPRTAAVLQRYLRAVVTRGTGNPAAHVPGYTTAGKTGTAQVVENGRYEPGEYVGSFIGYVPADHPRYVIFVKIERPRGAYYGGIVAAPVFTTLARVAMLHAGVMPAAPKRSK
jgi:cell division protein FtsI/penicillin-binding protein 2